MRNFIFIASAALLSACVSTEEMPLAANIVRIDTSARGTLFVGNTGNVTMHKAAEATVARGYDFFRLQDPQMGQGSQIVSANFSYAPTSEIGVTVIMFHAGESGAAGAFDAHKVLATPQ